MSPSPLPPSLRSTTNVRAARHRLLAVAALLAAAVLLAPLPTRGESVAVTRVEMEIETTDLRLTFWLNPPDLLQNVLGDTLGRRTFEDLSHLRREARRIGDYVAGHTTLRVDGRPLTPRDRGGWPPEVLPPAPPDAERDLEGRVVPPALPLTLRYRLPEGGARLDLELRHDVGEGFVPLFDVASWRIGSPYRRNDRVRAGTTLSFDLGDAELGAPPGPRDEPAREFLRRGFLQVVGGGSDHLLFVLALLLLAPRPGALGKLMIAFTLAHSLALALALTGIVRVPWRLVEPLIALSVVGVALDTVFRREASPTRRLIVFGFGLAHGFGFARALSEMRLPEAELLSAVPTYYLGLELGQLAALAPAALLLVPLQGREWYRRRVAVPASLVLAALGLFRLIQRTLGPG